MPPIFWLYLICCYFSTAQFWSLRERRKERKKISERLWWRAVCGFPYGGRGPSGGAVMENNVLCVYKRPRWIDSRSDGGEEDQSIASAQDEKSTSDRFQSNNPPLTCTLINVSTWDLFDFFNSLTWVQYKVYFLWGKTRTVSVFRDLDPELTEMFVVTVLSALFTLRTLFCLMATPGVWTRRENPRVHESSFIRFRFSLQLGI